MKEEKKSCSVKLPQDLTFATDYSCSCTKCAWMDGGKGDQIWCGYYKQYYDSSAGYDCGHFSNK